MNTRTYKAPPPSPPTARERPATLDITVDVHRPMQFPDGKIGHLAVMLTENEATTLAPNTRIVAGECQCEPDGLTVANTALFEMRDVDYDAAMQTMADLQDPAMPQVRVLTPHDEPGPATIDGPWEDNITW